MVNFQVDTIAEAMELGKAAAKLVTTYFIKPINLDFEKIYFPYLLISKKRYAGLFYTKPEKFDKLDCKGLESVRRDNCKLVKNAIETVLKKILIEQDENSAIKYVKTTISDLLQDKIDLSLLVITKGLTKEATDYKNPQPHTELLKKMRKRDPSTAPNIGDRVPYCIIKSFCRG